DVRRVAMISDRNERRIRSWSSDATSSSCSRIEVTIASTVDGSDGVDGSSRASNNAKRSAAILGYAANVVSMYSWEYTVPVWRRYFAYARRTTTCRHVRPARK